MTAKVTFIIEKELNNRVALDSSDTICTLNNLHFRKSEAFPGSKIKKVLDICNDYKANNVNTLLVRNKDLLTIWIEDKSKIVSTPETEIQESSQPQANTPQPDSSQLPTKKITKRYRGQVYEEEVVDWAAVKQINLHNKPRRKYRGQYID